MEFEVVGFGEGFFQELDGMIGILQRHGLFREEIEVAPGEVLGGGSGMGSGGLAASFHEVVDAQGADRVHEAHVDAALGDGLAFCVEAGGFVNGDVANGARREDALGAGEVEGAGVIEAVERIDAGDPGEDAAFFFVGEERDVGLRILDCGLRIADCGFSASDGAGDRPLFSLWGRSSTDWTGSPLAALRLCSGPTAPEGSGGGPPCFASMALVTRSRYGVA